MRIRTAILTIILLFLFASALPAAQQGIKVSAKTSSGKAIPLYSGSYALVIGNGDYTTTAGTPCLVRYGMSKT